MAEDEVEVDSEENALCRIGSDEGEWTYRDGRRKMWERSRQVSDDRKLVMLLEKYRLQTEGLRRLSFYAGDWSFLLDPSWLPCRSSDIIIITIIGYLPHGRIYPGGVPGIFAGKKC